MTVLDRIMRGAGQEPRQVITSDNFGPDGYPFGGDDLGLYLQQSLSGDREIIAPNFIAYCTQAFGSNPIIYACVANRVKLFAEARFQFRQRRNGQWGDIFGTQELTILEQPWPGGTTRSLLAIAEVHNSIAGNFYAHRLGDTLRIMRPDWTYALLGSMKDEEAAATDIAAEVLAYLYYEGGFGSGDPIILHPEDVLHHYETPDPIVPWRGISWITPVIQELLADKSMTTHRKKYMEGGATPNFAIRLDVKTIEQFREWVAEYRGEREGNGPNVNAYRTLFLGTAADPVPLGSNMRELDFSNTQTAGEVRIAAAAGVHPTVAGFSAGLQGSALNAGNFGEAFRQFADATIVPLWGNFAAAAPRIMVVPPGAELWTDTREIAALQANEENTAKIQGERSTTINSLITAGFVPDSVVAAVMNNDFTRLVHSGLYSVQLQAPGAGTHDGPPPPAKSNGKGNPKAVPAP